MSNIEIYLRREPSAPNAESALVGRDFVQMPWDKCPVKNPLSLLGAFHFYIHEHCMRMGQDLQRVTILLRQACEIFGLDAEVENLKRADGAVFEAERLAQGVSLATIKRDLTIVLAAIRHNYKWERITRVPYFEIPKCRYKKRRPMTDAEYKALMRQPMSWRLRMWNRIAYYTGHRAGAIETLTWSRVHMDTWTIDFNEPGARITNKRRTDGFPVGPDLQRILLAAWERRQLKGLTDPYVIGLSTNGKVTPTYKEQVKWKVAAGIPAEVVPRHSIRKNFVTGLLASGADHLKVAALISDKPAMMLEHYNEFSQLALRETAERRAA